MRTTVIIFLSAAAIVLAGCACSDIVKPVTVEEAVEKCAGKDDADHCYKDLGIDGLNPLVCKKIVSNGPQSKCLLYVAKGLMDPSLCSLMPYGGGAYSRQECYYQVAISAHDPGICDNLDKSTTYPKTDITGKPFDYYDCYKAATKGSKETFRCGEPGQACCVDMMNGCENNKLLCDSTYRCVPCGEPGQACCIGSFCSSGVCADDRCVACGGPNQPCCKDNSCTADGYACYQGSCKQVVQ